MTLRAMMAAIHNSLAGFSSLCARVKGWGQVFTDRPQPANIRAQYAALLAEREALSKAAVKAWPRSERDVLLGRVRQITTDILRIEARMK